MQNEFFLVEKFGHCKKVYYICTRFEKSRIVVPKVVGSNPIFHPNFETRRCRKTSFCFLYPSSNSFERMGIKTKVVVLQPLVSKFGGAPAASGWDGQAKRCQFHLPHREVWAEISHNRLFQGLEVPPRRADGMDKRSVVNFIFYIEFYATLRWRFIPFVIS